jgi:hypothetical protein
MIAEDTKALSAQEYSEALFKEEFTGETKNSSSSSESEGSSSTSDSDHPSKLYY